MFVFRLSGDTTKDSRSARWSRCTEKNMSSTLNVFSVRRLMAQLSTWGSIPARYGV